MTNSCQKMPGNINEMREDKTCELADLAPGIGMKMNVRRNKFSMDRLIKTTFRNNIKENQSMPKNTNKLRMYNCRKIELMNISVWILDKRRN